MDVYINSKGNAMIIEKWKVNLSQGTEGYKAYKKWTIQSYLILE